MTSQPLRILAVVSRPIVQVQTRQIKTVSLPAVQAVRDGLRRALRDRDAPVAVRYLPHATLSDLMSALAEPYDVLHFVGHGTEQGELLLEHEDGTADSVSPEVLVDALQDAEVDLALLSACHSRAAGRALQGAGIPDVVMVDEEWPMDAHVAALFNGLFYAHLARGKKPSRAYKAGLRAVKLDDRCGDRAGQPVDPLTGEEEPLYSERFEGSFEADEPLAAPEGEQGYEELRPLQVPCTVPAEEIFVGREVERIQTIRLMQATRWVTLVGPGGIGKTAAARRVARWQHERNHFPAGALAVDAAEVRSAEELTTAFAAALSDPRVRPDFRPDPHHPWAAIAAALDGRCLVLLDNAEDLEDDAVRALDEKLLSQAGELHLLATSHQPMGAVGREQTVEIDSLPVGAGRDPGPAERTFLAYVPSKRRPTVRKKHLATVRALCREIEGYPLGLVLTAAQLEDDKATVKSVLENIEEAMPEALAYARAANLPPRHKSVGAALKSSFDRLTDENEEARELLSHIAQFPGGASEEMLAALEEDGWQEAAKELRHSRLARWEDGRYTMLPPIRAVATDMLIDEEEQAAYRLRAAEYFREYAKYWQRGVDTRALTRDTRELCDADLDTWARQRLPDELHDQYAALSREEKEELAITLMLQRARAALEAERVNIGAAVRWAAEEHELVRELVDAVDPFLATAGYWRDLVQYERLALAAARAAGDQRAVAVWAHNLAMTLDGLGKKAEAEALYAEAEEVLDAPEHQREMASVLHQQGVLAQSRGDYDAALEHYRQAGATFEALGARREQASVLHEIGRVHQARGDYDAALDHYRRSLDIEEQLGDRAGVARSLHQIGMVHQDRGDYDAALDHYRRSLDIKQQLGDRAGVANSLGQIGMVHQQRGDYDAALEHYRRSLDIEQQLGDRAGVAQTLHNIGAVHQSRGDYDAALEHIQQAAQIFADIGDPVNLIIASRSIGFISIKLGDAEGVVQHFAQALHLALQVDPRPALETLRRMQDAVEQLLAAGQAETAAAMAATGLQVAEGLAEQLEGRKEQAAALCGRALRVIGLTASGEHEEALAQARQVDEATGDAFDLAAWVEATQQQGE